MGKGTGTCDNRPAMSLGAKDSIKQVKPILTSKGTMRFPQGEEINDFDVKQKGEWFLINPKPNKFAWKQEERFWRSVLLDKNGKILSIGFPKFGNFGENGFEDHQDIFNREIKTGNVWFAEKMDGSLAIRSVIDKRVMFRTRGSVDGEHGKAMTEVAKQKYPELLDPNFAPNSSILFEFVSPKPEFKIILSYQEEDLIMLGGVDHDDLSLWSKEKIEQTSAQHGLKKVETVEVPIDTEKLLEAVGDWSRREGVVARCDNGQVLVKVKSKSYLALHRLKSNLSLKNIKEQILKHKLKDAKAFEKHIINNGGDWEIIQDVKPYIDTYFSAQSKADQELVGLEKIVEEKKRQFDSKKNFATQYALKLEPTYRAAAFSIYSGEVERAKLHMREKIIEKAFENFVIKEEELEKQL